MSNIALSLMLALPVATAMVVDTRESADARLQAIVAGHDRATLDRGGWRNPWAEGDRYAVGEPLLATAVGAGVTSAGAGQAAPKHRFAPR